MRRRDPWSPSRTHILVLGRPEVLDGARALFASRLHGALPDARLSFAAAPEEIEGDAEVLISPTMPWLPDAIARLPGLRWLHLLSAGVDRLWQMDVPLDRLLISKSTGVHAATMSEFAIGAMLHFTKRLGDFARQQADHRWQRHWLGELSGRTLGVLGLGSVGRELARRARAFDMKVVGTRAGGGAVAEADAVFGPDGTAEVLARADFVVVVLPLTSATRGRLDRRAFKLMKPTACLINIARGGVVVEDDLVAALKAGEIAGAALDVFETEPLAPSSPLWAMDKVLITPHVAGTTDRYLEKAIDVFLANVESLRTTGALSTPVSVTAGY